MGSALADRLVGTGQRVIGWDIDDERRGGLRERRGEVAHDAQTESSSPTGSASAPGPHRRTASWS
jgi:3-hydroxyisobutyrate dehydrogenase-like beta-hydroxyacid dehydrogenase